MKRLFILLNNITDFNFSSELETYLPNYLVDIGTDMPISPNDYDLIVAWSYRKIIKKIPNPNNIIIFHSTDLPNGKGWAPIYNSIVNENKFFTITGILASTKVDAGDIVVRAKFRIEPQYMARDIRVFDNRISLLLISKILNKFDKGHLRGVVQVGTGSYNKRRTESDNEINIADSFSTLIPHLRACESNALPYFFYKNIKYKILVEPDIVSDILIPSDLHIEFTIN